jgi:hypothetical protein
MYKYFNYENSDIIIDYLDKLLPGVILCGFFNPLNIDGDIAYNRYRFYYSPDTQLNCDKFDIIIIKDELIMSNLERKSNSAEFWKFKKKLDLVDMKNYLKSYIRIFKLSEIGII